ncbi:MAG: hypothetical protein KatS3mg102_0731 [Planctomycetota bacterium]|nr:MAG: hypothetical protein KatS3mg102_0731 [Planctomycetota bacterium]
MRTGAWRRPRSAPGAALLAAALAAVLAGCETGGGAEVEAQAAAVPARALAVDVAPARAETIDEHVLAPGTLISPEEAWLAPEIDGVVALVHFAGGEEVQAGTRLIELDDELLGLREQQAEALLARARAQLEVARAALVRAQAEADNAAANLRRKRELFAGGATTEAVLTEAETAARAAEAARALAEAGVAEAAQAVAQAEAELLLARRQRADAVLSAPFAGALGERTVSPGDYVKKGERLVRLVALEPLEARFAVPERHLPRLAAGLRAEVTLEAYPGRRFAGEVVFVAPAVDPDTRTVTVRARLPNAERLLRPGAFCTVKLVFASRAAVVVPEEAIVPRGGKHFVYAVVGEGEQLRAERRQAVLGQRLAGRVEIRQGVRAGELVVAAGLQRVNDGAPVRIRRRLEASVAAGPARIEAGPPADSAAPASGE